MCLSKGQVGPYKATFRTKVTLRAKLTLCESLLSCIFDLYPNVICFTQFVSSLKSSQFYKTPPLGIVFLM